MKKQLLKVALLATFASCAFLSQHKNSNAQDWPQWNGPTRDGRLSPWTQASDIPKSGIPLLWKKPIGYGYSGPVVANGRAFVTDYQLASGKITNNAGTRDRLEGKERIVCLDAKSGETIWTHAYDRKYALSYPGGPRATPVVVEGTVISLGAEGDLICLSAESGKVLWQRQLADATRENPTPGKSQILAQAVSKPESEQSNRTGSRTSGTRRGSVARALNDRGSQTLLAGDGFRF